MPLNENLLDAAIAGKARGIGNVKARLAIADLCSALCKSLEEHRPEWVMLRYFQ